MSSDLKTILDLDPVEINICGVSGLHVFKYPTISDEHSCDSLRELLQIGNYPDNPFGLNGKFSCDGMFLNVPNFLQRQVDGGNVALGSHIENLKSPKFDETPPYPWYFTRMVIVELPDRQLLIYSPITLTDSVRMEIASLGSVAYVVAPNTWHHLSIADYQVAYPQAIFLGPADLVAKREDLHLLTCINDIFPASFGIELIFIPSLCRGQLEIALFHVASGTLISADMFYTDSTTKPFSFERPSLVCNNGLEDGAASFAESHRIVFNALWCNSSALLSPIVPNPLLPLYRFLFLVLFGDIPAMRATYQRLLQLNIRHVIASHVDLEGIGSSRIAKLLHDSWGWVLMDDDGIEVLQAAIKRVFLSV